MSIFTISLACLVLLDRKGSRKYGKVAGYMYVNKLTEVKNKTVKIVNVR